MQSLMPPIDSPNNLFSDGNPSTGALGTTVPALWMNNVQSSIRSLQRESLSILSAAGINPDGDKYAQVLESINKIIINSNSGVPYGVPLPWATNTPPTGYLLCNGASFRADVYPNLAAVYSSGVFPDLRGQTIKGLPASGRALLSQEADGNKSHSHSASASSTDLGSPSTTAYDYGTKQTNNSGGHSHDYNQFGQGGSSYRLSLDDTNFSNQKTATDAAGDHVHEVVLGPHSHQVQLGPHSHAITIETSGNAETTVKNTAFNYIVRAQ